MKKFSIASNVLLLGLAVFFGCKVVSNKNFTSDNSPFSSAEDSCKLRICKDYSNEPWTGLIDPALARQMAENYRADMGKKFIWSGTQATTVNDATSVWFDLEKLKKFIWEIEALQCEKNCGDTLGVRIYYAKYPDTAGMKATDIAMLNPTFANHHTVFMVPTYWDAALQANVDFDPLNVVCRARFNVGKAAVMLLPFPSDGSDDPNAENHGSLIPPGSSIGAWF